MGAWDGTLGRVPGLRRGDHFPAEAGRACQGHLRLRHQHHDLRPLHEAQTVVHAHAQAPLQDLQGAAVQRAARLGRAHVRHTRPWREGKERVVPGGGAGRGEAVTEGSDLSRP